MPIEMTERLERALESFAEVWVPGTLSQARCACDELLAAYREARDAPSVSGKSLWAAEPDDVRSRPDLEPITVADEGVRVEPRYETPLTVERLVRVLRTSAGDGLIGGTFALLADALEGEEE